MRQKWINTGAFIAMIAINALFNLLSFGGSTTGQIAESYPNLFTPAPITFAIWGLIYLLMALFILYQWGILDRGEYSDQVRERIGPWFAVSCALNILWLVCWHLRAIELSMVFIWLLLIILIMINRRLGDVGDGFLLRVSTNAGFSVYLGWIIAASIANINIWLTKINGIEWGLSSDLSTIMFMLVGSIIAVVIILISQNSIVGITIMWAYAGILLRHISPEYYNGAHPYVIAVGFLSEAIMLTAILIPKSAWYRGKPKRVYIQHKERQNGNDS